MKVRTLLLTSALLFPAAAVAEEPVDFSRDVRPILSKNCFACHGPDNAHRASKLRLDRRDSSLRALKSGHPALTPGNPEKSELFLRITSTDESERMPPQETGNE